MMLTHYKLTRWECMAGCGIFERGSLTAPLNECPTCGSTCLLDATATGQTSRQLPFNTPPRPRWEENKPLGHTHPGNRQTATNPQGFVPYQGTREVGKGINRGNRGRPRTT